MRISQRLGIALYFFAACALGCDSVVRQLPVTTGQPMLALVVSNGIDIEIEHSDTTLSSPPSRYAPELVYSEQSTDSSVDICVTSKYQGEKLDDISVQIIDVSELSELQLAALRDVHTASQAWATNNEGSQLDALALYTKSAKVLPTELARLVQLYAALAAANLYRLNEAYELAAAIDLPQEDSFFQHSVLWLKAEAKMLGDGGLDQTRTVIESAIDLAKMGYEKDLPAMMVLQSETYIALDQLEKGIAILEQAKAFAKQSPVALGPIYNNLGYVAIRRSYLANASNAPAESQRHLKHSVQIHLQAKDYAIAAGDYQLAALVFNNIGWLYEKLGNLGSAQYYLRRSLAASYVVSSNRSDTLIYGNLSDIYSRLGDWKKSEQFLQRAIASNEQGESSRLAINKCSLGTVKRFQSDHTIALQLHQECVGLLTTSVNTSDADQVNRLQQLVTAHVELAIDYIELNDLDAAVFHLDEARSNLNVAMKAEARHAELSWLKYRILAYTALVYARSGRLIEADEAIGTLPDIAEIGEVTDRVEVMTAVMESLVTMGDRERAIKFGLKLLVEIESVYPLLEVERLGPAWSNKTHGVYDTLIGLLFESYTENPDRHASILYSVVERSRAPSLRRTAVAQSESDVGELAKLNRLSALANELAGERESNTELERYRTHDAYLAKDIGSAPEQLSPVSLQDLQDGLRENSAFIYFVLIEKQPFIMEVRADSFRTHQLAAHIDFSNLLEEVYENTAAPGTDGVEVGERLSQILPRSLEFEGLDTIWFVLHKQLHGLPTGLLRSKGEFLNQDKLVLVTPSATTWLREEPQSRSELDLAILSDPIFNEDDLREPNAAPPTSNRSWSDSLVRLPWTAREADLLKDTLSDRRVVSYTGRAANRQNLYKVASRGARILHLASHGYFAGDDVDNVGLILSSEVGSPNAAFITLTEIMSVHFENELVVVSGCETARGERMSGEGPLSLSRTFVAQGVNHVLGTLWPVSDRASARFMEMFYKNLIELNNVAEALSMTQSQMRSSSRYRDPYFWASYVLTSVASPEFSPEI